MNLKSIMVSEKKIQDSKDYIQPRSILYDILKVIKLVTEHRSVVAKSWGRKNVTEEVTQRSFGGGDGTVLYLDYDGGYTDLYMYQNPQDYVYPLKVNLLDDN